MMGEVGTRSEITPDRTRAESTPFDTAARPSLPSALALAATTAMPEYRLPATTSQLTTTKSPTVCTTCLRGGNDRMLHRLHDGVLRHHCSSCILLLHKSMYCSLCYQVYSDTSKLGDPGMWLTCSKCQRLSHLDCASDHGLSTDSLLFTCRHCKHDAATKASDDASHVQKKARVNPDSSDRMSSEEEALAAAQIVAALAANKAREAKVKARASAAVAVKAAACAKAALDSAFRAGREEAKWRAEALKLFPGGLPAPQDLKASCMTTGPNRLELRKSGNHDAHLHQLSRLGSNEGELSKPSGNAATSSLGNAVPSQRHLLSASETSPTPLSSLQCGAILSKQQQQKSEKGCVVVDGKYNSTIQSVHMAPLATSVPSTSIPGNISLVGTPKCSSSPVKDASGKPKVQNPQNGVFSASKHCGPLPGSVKASATPHMASKLSIQADDKDPKPSIGEVAGDSVRVGASLTTQKSRSPDHAPLKEQDVETHKRNELGNGKTGCMGSSILEKDVVDLSDSRPDAVFKGSPCKDS